MKFSKTWERHTTTRQMRRRPSWEVVLHACRVKLRLGFPWCFCVRQQRSSIAWKQSLNQSFINFVVRKCLWCKKRDFRFVVTPELFSELSHVWSSSMSDNWRRERCVMRYGITSRSNQASRIRWPWIGNRRSYALPWCTHVNSLVLFSQWDWKI